MGNNILTIFVSAKAMTPEPKTKNHEHNIKNQRTHPDRLYHFKPGNYYPGAVFSNVHTMNKHAGIENRPILILISLTIFILLVWKLPNSQKNNSTQQSIVLTR